MRKGSGSRESWGETEADVWAAQNHCISQKILYTFSISSESLSGHDGVRARETAVDGEGNAVDLWPSEWVSWVPLERYVDQSRT